MKIIFDSYFLEEKEQENLDVWALSKNLKETLNNREQSKEKFAKEIKIATSTLYQILKGDRLPSIDTFRAIVRVLNVSADTLLNKTEGGIAA
ncbi:MAG: helix-turn-helix domain-containing protein [Anaerobutyricum soehngenii]